MLRLHCFVLLAIVSLPRAGSAEELWAGHQILIGVRKLPILGELHTRTESFQLAVVERHEGEIHLKQRTCRMEIAPVAGVKVSFLPEGVPKMPSSSIIYTRRGAQWEGGPWVTEWDESDVDGDGNPGATVKVEAPICGGTLFVGGFSRSSTRATEKDGGLVGEMRSRVGHRILDTSGGCLKLAARDSEENVSGTFAYVPVPSGATCESLMAQPWPAKAPEVPVTQGTSAQRKGLKLR